MRYSQVRYVLENMELFDCPYLGVPVDLTDEREADMEADMYERHGHE